VGNLRNCADKRRLEKGKKSYITHRFHFM